MNYRQQVFLARRLLRDHLLMVGEIEPGVIQDLVDVLGVDTKIQMAVTVKVTGIAYQTVDIGQVLDGDALDVDATIHIDGVAADIDATIVETEVL
jgi:hypothetical protein